MVKYSSRIMIETGHLGHLGGRETEMHTGLWWRNLTDRDRSEYIGIDRGIIFKWIFKLRFGVWTGLIWLRKQIGDEFL